MVQFIFGRIMAAKASGGVDAGRNKYKAYFISIKTYLAYKEAVNMILKETRNEDCIVEG